MAQDMNSSASSFSVTTQTTTPAPRGNFQVYHTADDPNLRMAQQVFGTALEDANTANTQAQTIERDANGRIVDAIKQATAAKVDRNTADYNRAQQVADTYAQITDVFSADATDSGSVVGDHAIRIQELDRQLTAEDYALSELEGKSFFSDPLGWISAQMQLPERQARYNAAVREFNADSALIDDLTKKAANSANIKANEIPTITAAQSKADAEGIKAQGSVDADNATIAAARSNSAYAKDRLQLANMGLSAAEQENQRIATEQYREIESINSKLRWDSDYASRELNRIALREKIESAQLEEISVDAAAEKLGYTSPQEKAIFKNNYKRAPAETKNSILRISSGQFGVSPYESYRVIAQLGQTSKISPNYQRMFQAMRQIDLSLANDKTFQATLPSNAKERLEIIDKEASSRFISQYSMPGGNDINALGFELSPEKMLLTMEQPAIPDALKLPPNHPAVIAAQGFVAAKTVPTTSGMVQAISAQVAKQGGGMAAAAEAIANYYQVNTGLNRVTQDVNGFGAGLEIPNSYNAILETPGALSSRPVVVDLTNRAQIQAFLLKQVVSDLPFNQQLSVITGEPIGNPFPNVAPVEDFKPANLPAPTKILGADRK